MDKFIAACMIFAFISGAYFTELIESRRANDKGCVVKLGQGNEVHVILGREP